MDATWGPPEGKLPAELLEFVRDLPSGQWRNVRLILADREEVRDLANIALVVRAISLRAPRELVAGTITPEEFVLSSGRIRAAIAELRARSKMFLARLVAGEGGRAASPRQAPGSAP